MSSFSSDTSVTPMSKHAVIPPPCTIFNDLPKNILPNIGRTKTTLKNCLSHHRNSIRTNYEACAMVKHGQNNPGDKYDLDRSRTI